jgi:hypothetical protein
VTEIPRIELAALVLVWIAAAGCGGVRTVRARAANDLHCPEADVSVEELGAGGYAARGCGASISYTCRGNLCVPYGESAEVAATPAAPPSVSDLAVRTLVDANASAVLACAPAAAALAVEVSWTAGALRTSVRGGTDETNACVGAIFAGLSMAAGTPDVRVLHAVQRVTP